MLWIFVAAAALGGAFLLPMLLGGLDTDVGDGLGEGLGDGVDVDLDADLELDSADGGDGPAMAGGSPLGAIFASLVSFRTIVFFSAFFGASGLVFSALDYSQPVTLATATLIGVVAAVANSALFGLIKSSQANSQISDRTLEGRPARVVLPMDDQQRGRIRIDLSGQPQYLVARPIADGSTHRFDVGASVVVVRIENGTALVASLAELDSGEEY